MYENPNDKRPIILNQPTLMKKEGGYDTHLYIDGVKSELTIEPYEMREFTKALQTLARIMNYRLIIDTSLAKKERESS